MTIRLAPVTRDNWETCIGLTPADDQKGFVASNLYSLAESKFETSLVPTAIYAGEEMVGFLMWGQDPADNKYWIVRLMIDRHHQRKGFDRAALDALVSQLGQRPDCQAVYISYKPDNHGAERLYEQVGFRRTGEVLFGEVVSKLDLLG